jgi:uncharacterized protein (UPF0332 family)
LTPEAARYLEKAEKCISDAKISLGVGLNNDAGRGAYLAAFHAAQAFIFERTGKVAKTHRGVHVEFARLSPIGLALGDNLRTFLQRAYNLKAVADYETGPDSELSPERAAAAIEDARTFLTTVATGLRAPPPD